MLAGYDVATQTATYAVTINPLVNWIWIGFGVMALGTGLALLPETAFAFAAAKVPAGGRRRRRCCCCSCSLPTSGSSPGQPDGPGRPAKRAGAPARRGDHLHVRLPPVADELRHAELRGARGADGEDAAVS